MARILAGTLLLADRTDQGWVEVDGGRVVQRGHGAPPRAPDEVGWIVPSPVNAHTHVADAFLRHRSGKPHSVKELVGPGGWKHQQLAAAPAQTQAAGVHAMAKEMAACSTAAFLDFREGGLAGVRWLRAQDLPVAATILGRPEDGGFDEAEAHALLAEADGVGLSGVRDMKTRDIEAWSDACREVDKPFAIHVSEDERDDIDAVVALEPTFVVHMTQAHRRDLEALGHAGIPIVVCARSNRWFGMRPPLQDMLEAGCTLAMGTDNGMLHDGDIWEEAAVVASLMPETPVETVLHMATHAGRALTGLPDPFEVGASADVVVLPEVPLRAPAPIEADNAGGAGI